MASLCKRATRKKHAQDLPQGDVPLERCLTTFDLTLMGIGSMVGSGIYIMTGVAAKHLAGPAMFLSFLVAAVAIYLMAGCFLEFAGRVRRTGSTYVFMYISLGELPAFVLGVGLLVGLILGGATNGRAWSAYLDFLLDGRIANFTETHIARWDVGPPIAKYPDFLAATIIAILTAVVSVGAQCSARFNTLFAILNVLVLLFVTVVGFVFADVTNWTSEEMGGFAPYGWTGVLSGSGSAFWAFLGFEILCVCQEEAKEPQKSIPRGTVLSILIVTFLYMGVAASITLVTSYKEIDDKAPLPSAFAARGITWAMYVASVGPLFGLTTTLLSSVFGAVRLGYAMADDGLLPSVFAWVSPRFKVPVVTSLVMGGLMCATSLCFELRDLLGFAIVVALLQYIFIAAAVIFLRYHPVVEKADGQKTDRGTSEWEMERTDTFHSVAKRELSVLQGQSSPLPSSSLSDSEGFDPSLDIRQHSTLANQKPAVQSRDGTAGGHRLRFLSEDLDGDGFTTTEDEMVLFDARKIPSASQKASSGEVDAAEYAAKQRVTSNSDSTDEHGDEPIDKGTSQLIGNGAATCAIRDQWRRESVLKSRCGCLESLFKPCRDVWIPLACSLLVLSVWAISALLFEGERQNPDTTESQVMDDHSVNLTGSAESPGNVTQGASDITGSRLGHSWWSILLMSLAALTACLLILSIWIHRQSDQQLTFRLPCVPVLPSLAILFCSLLMFSNATLFSWIGCGCIVLFSVVFYFSYSIRHSKLDADFGGKSLQTLDSDRARLLEAEDSEDEI